MISFFIALVNAFIVLLAFYNFYYKRLRLPPGPTPLPLIGNMHSVMRNPPGEKCFLAWRKQYGAMYTFWFGESPVIWVAEHEKMVELFQKDAETYSGRFTFEEADRLMKGGTYGVVFTQGELWREHRRFTLHVLRDFGLGKNLMQERILDEFMAMATKLDRAIDGCSSTENELNIAMNFIDPAVGSIINNILVGYRFDGDQLPEFYELKRILENFLASIIGITNIITLQNPRMFTKLPYFRDAWNRNKKIVDEFDAFFERQIDKHRKEIDFSLLDVPATDYVEAYLREQAKLNGNANIEHTYTDDQLKGMLVDMWIAGQETTSTTLAWGMAFLINYPAVMAKMQAELIRVVSGNQNQLITVTDRFTLHYTNAVINEIQRMANVLPQNFGRLLNRDVSIDGYWFPKGTVIVPQISSVHIDNSIFQDPDKFHPERFLDSEGKLQKCDALIPFSLGKRQCLGESLARMELFLFIANFFHRYTLFPGKEVPSLVRQQSFVVRCPKFTCRVKKNKLT